MLIDKIINFELKFIVKVLIKKDKLIVKEKMFVVFDFSVG